MKSKLRIILITILLVLTSVVTSYAATATIELNVDNAEVKVGDTFTVTLSANCSDGINGIITTFDYDKNKLEYVSEGVVDTSNYAFGGNKDAKEIFVYCTSTDSIQSADIYALTFRVKEGATVGSTAKISIAKTTLDSDSATNSEHILAEQEIAVKIVEEAPAKLSEIKVVTKPNKTDYIVGENFNSTGMVIKAKYEDGTEKNVTNYTITNGSNLDTTQKYVTISYTEDGITKTTKQAITVSHQDKPEASAPTDIVKFEILSKPNKLQYIKDKEQLDITGGKLKLTYDDNSTKELDFSHVEVQVIGFDNTRVGKNLITVLYRNETASFYVDIVEESNPGGDTGSSDDEDKGDNSGNGDNTGTGSNTSGDNAGTGGNTGSENNNSAGGNASSDKNAGTKEDALATEKEYPKAGLNTMLSLGIVAIVVLIIIYRKNQKYRDIK